MFYPIPSQDCIKALSLEISPFDSVMHSGGEILADVRMEGFFWLSLQVFPVAPYICTYQNCISRLWQYMMICFLQTDLENNSPDQINIKPCEYTSELSSVQILLLFPMTLATKTVTLRSQSEPVSRYQSYFVSKQTLHHNYCPTRFAIYGT